MEEVPFTNTMPISRRALLQHSVMRRKAYLEPEGIPSISKPIELKNGNYRIGRSNDCEIKVSLNNISRIHARIYEKKGEYVLEDLRSTNGTFVNGVRIVWCTLRDGDIIEIGEAKFNFYEEKVRENS
ncbi:MAG: FHA domain-containing protein [Lentisphaerae bacterium]|nr:MAG: FHA domain-containing protein [Lentisphaerota bacterium]